MYRNDMIKTSKWKLNATLFIFGQGITLFGSMLVNYAVQWHITLTSKSGIAMMLFTLSAAVPMFIISPFAGIWADRHSKKLIINLADAAIALITLLMGLLFSLGFEYMALLLICAAARGFGQGVQTPAVNSLLPEIVPERNLLRFNGVNSSLQSVIMFVSPIVGGVLITVLPIQYVLFVDVATAAIGISLLLIFVKIPLREKIADKKNAWNDLVKGMAYIKNHAFIKKFMIVSALFNFLVAPTALLTMLQTTRDFGEDTWRLVAIELAFFIGMAFGGVIIGVWGGFKNKSYTIAVATAISGLCTIGLGLADNFAIYLFFMALAGITVSSVNAPIMTIIQTKVDADYMGRVFSVFTMLSSIMMPVGMLLWGPLADVVSIDWLLILSGMGIIVTGALFVVSKTLREAGISH
ncbi:MAG: MFS transporter [Eubacterium sp.]|nr:MFS transporter [Eubacterium sp.]